MVFQDAVNIETNNNEIRVKKIENLNAKIEVSIKQNGIKDCEETIVEKVNSQTQSNVNDSKKDHPIQNGHSTNENTNSSKETCKSEQTNENIKKEDEIVKKEDENVKKEDEKIKKEDEKTKKEDEKNEKLELKIKDEKKLANEKSDKLVNDKNAENLTKTKDAQLETALKDLIKDVKKMDKIKKNDDKKIVNSPKSIGSKLDFKEMQIKIETNLEKLKVENEKELTFEDCLENGRQMMIKFLDNQFEEVIGILEHQSEISIIHKLGSAAVRFFDSILSMDKEKMAIALQAMREAADYADRHRKKTGYISYLITPDYNTFTDVECHAELCFATCQLVLGLLIALDDQSIYGFINGGLKIRMAHSSFKECYNIFKSKFNWDSNVARMHFESGTRLGIGSFDLIISFFPTKLAKLLEYIGFNSDRDQAVDELTQAVSLVDGLYYDISSILLSAYYGFLEYFYGLGESYTEFFDKSSIVWQKRTPNSSVVKIGYGIREMMLGEPDKAIKFFKECIDGQDFWIQLHYACNWEICWAYAMKSDWKNAAKYAEKLKNECKWSPAMFTYLYAVFLFMEMEKDNKPELADKISIELKKIPKLKRKLGGKKAFHEKIVLDRSKKFHNNVHNLLLPPLELLYIWNVFHMMAKQPKLIMPMLNDVENKLKIHTKSNDTSKSLDQYCYLIFMKGVMKRHLDEKTEAIKLFEEVISCKKRIKEEIHLLPQAYFELGMIYRSLKRPSEAKRMLKRARDDYSNYLSECMINFRVVNALDLIKKEKLAADSLK